MVGVFFLLLIIAAAITFVVLIFIARKDQNGRVHEFLSKYLPSSWINPSEGGYGMIGHNDNFDDPLGDDEESHQPSVLNDKDIDQIFDRNDNKSNSNSSGLDDFNPRNQN